MVQEVRIMVQTWCAAQNRDEGSSVVPMNWHRNDVEDPEENATGASGLPGENWGADANGNAEFNGQVVESIAGRSYKEKASSKQSREQSDVLPVNVSRENGIGS